LSRLGTTISIPLNGEAFVSIDWEDETSDIVPGAGLIRHTYKDEGDYRVEIRGVLAQLGRNVSHISSLDSVSSWGNLGITSLSYAFNNAKFLTSLPDSIPTEVTNCTAMFEFSTFNSDISGWDMSNVTNMSGMFGGATSFAGDISGWDVSNVTDMSSLFSNASSFNSDLSNWDVSHVITMFNMFSGATSFNSDLSSWDISHVINMSYMLMTCNLIQ